MVVLFCMMHPAQVHLFRNAARLLGERGHGVLVAARDKDVTLPLAKLYGLPVAFFTKPGKGKAGTAFELAERNWTIASLARRHKIDFLLGPGASITWASRVTRAKSIVFAQDDAEALGLYSKLFFPLADLVATPACLEHGYGKRHLRYASYHQLAYLHPNHFTPDPGVYGELGLTEGAPYFIVRFVLMRAHHDTGHRGISPEMGRRLIRGLSERGRVFITTEGRLPDEFEVYRFPIPPDRMHHALYYATLFVGDSQSMTMEAATLGTPAVRCNTWVGKLRVVEEMEQRYGLTYGFRPEHEEAMYAKVFELLDRPDLKEEWASRRAKLLAEKVDLTQLMIELLEGYPDSIERLQAR